MNNQISTSYYVSQGGVGWDISPTDTNSTTFISTTPSNTEMKIVKDSKKVSPRLYFKYVKSKLNKIEQSKLNKRLKELSVMMEDAAELGQDALYDHVTKLIAVIVRESEAYACKADKWIEKSNIEKFMHKIDGDVGLDKLEDFPRTIPGPQKRRIMTMKGKNIFDNYHILYMKAPEDNKIESTEKKIARKDPIAFGTFSFMPERYYYITDWEDEYCDITIEKLADVLSGKNKEFELNKIPEMDEKFFKLIKDEVLARHKRLADTNFNTWKEKLKEEREARKESMKRIKEQHEKEIMEMQRDQIVLRERLEESEGIKTQAKKFTDIFNKFFGKGE